MKNYLVEGYSELAVKVREGKGIGTRPGSLDILELLDIDFNKPLREMEKLLGAELVWQPKQVALVGYVSEPLSSIATAHEHRTSHSGDKIVDLPSPAPEDYATKKQSVSENPIGGEDFIAIESELLDQLPKEARDHMINFVRKAREKRKDPILLRLREDLLKAAMDCSRVASFRLMQLGLEEDMPFHAYDFYSNTLLTRMILRPKENEMKDLTGFSQNAFERAYEKD